MWLFAFDAPAGTRILSRDFFGVTTYCDRWYSDDDQKWMTTEDIPEDHGGYSSHYICRSFKAFKRHLRKHPELRNADEVVLTSRYDGHDIHARWYEI